MLDKIDGNKEERKEMMETEIMETEILEKEMGGKEMMEKEMMENAVEEKETMEMKETTAKEEAQTKAAEIVEQSKPAIREEAEPEPVSEAEPEKAPAPVSTAEAEAEPKTAVETQPKRTGYWSEIDGVEVDFELQYRDRETDMKDIAKRVREDYAKRGNDASKIELIQIYLKPTDFTAYYVVNNSYEGKIPLF